MSLGTTRPHDSHGRPNGGPFAGLSAFPLTPLRDDAVDEAAFAGLVQRLVAAGVDSITALGSTGSYAYLAADERRRVAGLAVEHAGATPVLVGVGALRTSQILAHVDDAERAGAAGVLLAPVSYQPLTRDDVFGLYRAVAERTELPIVVYDNPGTTRFAFDVDLYARIAELPGIASIKIPGVPLGPATGAAADAGTGIGPDLAPARERIAAIRAAVPGHVTIGVSGDASAAAGLNAGCDAWYSVIGGTLPELALAIARAAQQGRAADAAAESQRLAPLWGLFAEFGSLRVTAAVAEHLGLAPERCLPLPIQGLHREQRTRVASVIDELGLGA